MHVCMSWEDRLFSVPQCLQVQGAHQCLHIIHNVRVEQYYYSSHDNTVTYDSRSGPRHRYSLRHRIKPPLSRLMPPSSFPVSGAH